eukprot:6205832-Pleurochrysis_carterae.AAC.1
MNVTICVALTGSVPYARRKRSKSCHLTTPAPSGPRGLATRRDGAPSRQSAHHFPGHESSASIRNSIPA